MKAPKKLVMTKSVKNDILKTLDLKNGVEMENLKDEVSQKLSSEEVKNDIVDHMK